QLAEEAEDRGLWTAAFGSGETLGVAIDALAGDWPLATERLCEMLLEPAFPEDRLEWMRRRSVAELEAALDQPDVKTGIAFAEQLYSPHPYGRPLQGDRDSLTALTREDCERYHRRCLAHGGCLAVVGAIDPERVMERLERLLTGLPAARPPGSTPPAPAGLGGRREVQAGEADQAHLFVGHTTAARTSPDLPALELLGVILGAGGLAGRLPTRLREREGLAYQVDVATAAGAGLDAGRRTVYLGTSPRQVEHAEAVIREELARLVELGASASELEEARGFLLGREPFRRETLRQRADLIAESELYGLGVDRDGWWPRRLRAVDLKTLNAAARRWIRPEALRVTVGLPRPSE
ncbi:MAG: pitrilysin family protein, partial [Acidobacteriota bacterium]